MFQIIEQRMGGGGGGRAALLDGLDKCGQIGPDPRVMAEKLRVDTRMKLIGRLNRRLAENHKQEISGPDGGPLENLLSITPEIEDRIKRLASVRVAMTPPHGYENTSESG